MKRVMQGLIGIGVMALVLSPSMRAQTRVMYLNGVAYVFPSADGATGTFLRTDGAGGLSWASPPTPEGLWSGSAVYSTVACPSGWTELAAAANKFIRVSTTAGTTGGSDTHTHSMTGVTGSTAVSISGSTGATTATHTHTYSGSGTTSGPSGKVSAGDLIANGAAGGMHTHTFSWSGTTSSGGASHSHGAGTLSGASHGHAAGSLAAASASNVPAYYTLRLCVKD